MKLSVVLATFNEAENIKDCLDSVQGWCDEVVIVDGGSIDDTARIARSFNARVVIADNPELFHINKQKAINLAKGEWILQLDADERVSKRLKDEIDRAIVSKENNGYWMPRKNYFLGRFLMKGGVYPDNTLRLYRRGKGKLPQKDVHEQAEVIGNVGYLKEPLIHMADPNLRRYLIRFDRYTSLIAKELKIKEKHFSISGLLINIFLKPMYWFLLTYVRHKGFMDSWQGFLFSFLSSLRFSVGYLKFIKILS